MQFSASYPADMFLKQLKAGRYQRSLANCPEQCDTLVRSRTSVASVDTCNCCGGVWFTHEELVAALRGIPDELELPRAAKEIGALGLVDIPARVLLAVLFG